MRRAGAFHGGRRDPGAGASDAGLVPDAPVAPELAAEAAPDVDAVLTVREFGRLLRLVGVDCTALSRRPSTTRWGFPPARPPFSDAPAASWEAALRSAAFLITGENPDFSACDTTAATPETPWMSRELAIGDATVRIAVASGLENTSKLLDALESGRPPRLRRNHGMPGRMRGWWQPAHPVQQRTGPGAGRRAEPARRRGQAALLPRENPDIAKLYMIGSASRCRIRPLSGCTDQESWQI